MPQRIMTMSDVSREEFLQLKSRLDDACRDVQQIKRDTGEIVEAFQALSGGFKVLQGLGKLARPIGYIAAAVAAVAGAWATIRGIGK